MSKIMVSIPLTKYLKLQSDFFGGPQNIFLTKLDKGKVYISEGKPWIDEEDLSNIDFEGSFAYIPKDFSKYIELKPRESKSIEQVLKQLKAKEKEQN